jgi:hypothetical protein
MTNPPERAARSGASRPWLDIMGEEPVARQTFAAKFWTTRLVILWQRGLDMFTGDAGHLGEECGKAGCRGGVGWGGGVEDCVGTVNACAEVAGGGLRVGGCYNRAHDGDAGEFCMGMRG